MASIIGVETLQHTNGTTAAEISSGGVITTPKRPYWRVQGNGDRVTSTGIVTWNGTLAFEQGSGWDSTGKQEYTIPVAGLWHFEVMMFANGTNHLLAHIEVNSNRKAHGQVNSTSNGSSDEGMNISLIYECAVNDVIRVKNATGQYHLNAETSFFSGYLIG